MSQSKPLAYLSAKVVLEYASFGKRKHFYAMCPGIRKIEENLPYHLELVRLDSIEQDDVIISIDSYSFCFRENMMRMINLSTYKDVDQLTCLGPEQAAEKFLLYNLSREGTHIKNVELTAGPEFISKCIPVTIKNLIVNRTAAWFPTNIPIENVKVDTTVRADTLKMAKHVTVRIYSSINTDILSEWNCESIRIESGMSSEQVADYCNKVSKRTDRPIGSRLMAVHVPPVKHLIDFLPSKEYARETMLNDIQCVTISIDESTELNVYSSSVQFFMVVVDVCARGTAIDQNF
ncbi:hypothetical protein GCK72_020745 [Caenorhabditis remanei]|uniref:DUF38 domain-containing protein n=1 Tax=Caenorhabditis remanei TaxID=31234 RepID=A0A6A5GI04_CAERE|nr:hypothetical protein GCK72_020745 [Caenorhabditis remanei]KAF1754185.1 hypothetical protein GCK72_020745 [Caenorhabditis remanei]